ncbi:cytochrome P450 [Kineobactrum salinum]|uniref:Cytochrome P450 n=1 Tax=Kineobactrum salinum TaxID=2708301 RepID=A0A6C0U8F4_9GAMM|nr:cytochrome P450 [Kineobactrum salinum]QIB66795.1 cytochrome P450 [Kineobactrum salinum]
MDADPYPRYHSLRQQEPVSWVGAFNMYLLTRYDDVQTVLRDTTNFIVGTEHSLLLDTFGEHMLTTEGEQHALYKTSLLTQFRPARIRVLMESAIAAHVDSLIDEFEALGRVELREAFASRLPVKTVLSLFGLPQSDEGKLRNWYDAFEKALANFTWDSDIRTQARRNVADFHAYLQQHIEDKRANPDGLLLDQMLDIKEPRRLSDAEVRTNALIIFFGGISTVEALILNAVYAIEQHPAIAARLRTNHDDIPLLLDEVVRWSGPVQSATRHVAHEVTVAGVSFQPGDTVNCMLAAANRDPGVFQDPDRFDIDRPNLRRHIGFALGAHHCLGSHLARLESGLAIRGLLDRLPNFRCDPEHQIEVRGFEFRQPRSLQLVW